MRISQMASMCRENLTDVQHQCQRHGMHHEDWKQSCQGEDSVERQQQRLFDKMTLVAMI